MSLLTSDVFLSIARILRLVTIASDTSAGTVHMRSGGTSNLQVIVTIVRVVSIGVSFDGSIASKSSLIRRCRVHLIWLPENVLHILRVLAGLESVTPEPRRLSRLEAVCSKA